MLVWNNTCLRRDEACTQDQEREHASVWSRRAQTIVLEEQESSITVVISGRDIAGLVWQEKKNGYDPQQKEPVCLFLLNTGVKCSIV